jgi:hypothetical protein
MPLMEGWNNGLLASTAGCGMGGQGTSPCVHSEGAVEQSGHSARLLEPGTGGKEALVGG